MVSLSLYLSVRFSDHAQIGRFVRMHILATKPRPRNDYFLPLADFVNADVFHVPHRAIVISIHVQLHVCGHHDTCSKLMNTPDTNPSSDFFVSIRFYIIIYRLREMRFPPERLKFP